jgi:hypothetical protein
MMTYIPALLDALLTLNLALAIHPTRDKDAVVRKTARRLKCKQEGMGKEYLTLLIASKSPYKHLVKLQTQLSICI